MKVRFATAMMAIAMLCACAMAENTSVNQKGISGNISERNPFQNAVQEYDHALQLDSGNASAWLGRADISRITGKQAESRGYFQKALSASDKILQDNPEDDDSWWLKAESHEALYMDDAAIQAYEKVVELHSLRAVGAWIRIADIHFTKANGYNQSKEAFSNATKLMPDNATWAGGSSWDQGNSILRTDIWKDDNRILRVTIGSYNKSIKEYDYIQQIAAKPVSTWLFRGNRIDSVKTSTEFMAAATRLQQNVSDGWYKTSQDLFKNGSYEESVNAINRAIELDSQNATLWDAKASSLGIAASFGGNRSQYNESLKAQDKAIELDPGNSTLHIHKGFLIASLADLSGHQNKSLYEEAIKEYDEAIKLDPKNEEAWNYKASVLDTRLNRSAEALLAYDKAIELDGENAVDNESMSNAWSGKGTALAKLGRYNESFEAFDKSIELSPQTAAFVWLSKGEALNESKRYDEAVKAYDKVVELSPESATIPSALACCSKGDALLAWGKYDEAVKAYDEAIEQYPLDSMGAQAWYKKGLALKALGRQAEADATNVRAKELGYKA